MNPEKIMNVVRKVMADKNFDKDEADYIIHAVFEKHIDEHTGRGD